MVDHLPAPPYQELSPVSEALVAAMIRAPPRSKGYNSGHEITSPNQD